MKKILNIEKREVGGDLFVIYLYIVYVEGGGIYRITSPMLLTDKYIENVINGGDRTYIGSLKKISVFNTKSSWD